MEKPKQEDLAQCKWFPYREEPFRVHWLSPKSSLYKWLPQNDSPLVIRKLFYVTKFCDPQILLPEQSCDGKWHLFFHNYVGLYHFTSTSGLEWTHGKMIEVLGHSPFIFRENENFYLLYEKHERHIPLLNKKRDFGENEKDDSYSRIEMRTSTDLVTWSKPRLLLDSRTIPFAGDYLKYPRISRPQMIKTAEGYRLYFGASHLVLPDTGQKVSRYFGCASSPSLSGPYSILRSEKPLLEPIPDDCWANLGCGSIRVVPCNGKLYAFQCPVYWDEKRKRTATCMLLLSSEDGYEWKRCSQEPILRPADKGWASSYIMGCDVQYKQDESWYCYFSASGKKTGLLKKESIGLLIGNIPRLPSARV